MQKLLIAESTGTFASALTAALGGTYEITCCQCGHDALRLLQELRPRALIIDLSLPYMDGLQVLRKSAYRPPVVIALTSLATDYVLQMAKDAGAHFVLLLPCTVRSVVYHLEELCRRTTQLRDSVDPQRLTETLLQSLGIPVHQAGYQQLRVGIPLFAQDESQHLNKELYTAIATICGNDNQEQIERSIRECIHKAWKHRDEAAWRAYFPDAVKAPSNKVFIAVLAQRLRQSMPDKIW